MGAPTELGPKEVTIRDQKRNGGAAIVCDWGNKSVRAAKCRMRKTRIKRGPTRGKRGRDVTSWISRTVLKEGENEVHAFKGLAQYRRTDRFGRVKKRR